MGHVHICVMNPALVVIGVAVLARWLMERERESVHAEPVAPSEVDTAEFERLKAQNARLVERERKRKHAATRRRKATETSPEPTPKIPEDPAPEGAEPPEGTPDEQASEPSPQAKEGET